MRSAFLAALLLPLFSSAIAGEYPEVTSMRDVLIAAERSPTHTADATLGGPYRRLMESVFRSTHPILIHATVAGIYPKRPQCALFDIVVSQKDVVVVLPNQPPGKPLPAPVDETGKAQLGLCPDGTVLLDPRINPRALHFPGAK